MLALLLIGCGTEATVVNQATAIPAPTPARQAAKVVGKLTLGVDVPGAELSLQRLDGNVLARGTTGATGNLAFEELELPADFRVVACIDGTPAQFSTEVRGYQGGTRVIGINLLTTLASQELRATGGTLEEAEARVRRALAIPSTVALYEGVQESPRSPFSHITFFRAAGQQGGFEASLPRALNANPTPYLLTRSQLSTPVTGLDAGLTRVVEEARTFLAGRLVFSAESVRLDSRPKRGVRARFFSDSEGGQFLNGVCQGVTASVVTATFGFIAHQLGFLDGTQQELDQIQQQLDQIQAEIQQFQTEFQVADYNNSASFVAGNVSVIASATGSLINATATIPTPNLPQITANPFLTGINALNASTFQACTNVLAAPMLGISTSAVVDMIVLGQDLVLQQLGLETAPQLYRFPVRTNNLLDQALQTYSKYYGYQVEGLNLLSETAHRGDGADPAPRMNQTVPVLLDTTVSLKQQRQQQPLYLPRDDVVVDLQFGIMWYANVQSADTYYNAKAFAKGLSLQGNLPDGTQVTYADWRLPTYAEMLALQARGTYCAAYPLPGASPSAPGYGSGYAPGVPVNSKNAYPDVGQAQAGLPGLGFVLPTNGGLNSDGSLWFQAWDQEAMYGQYNTLANGYSYPIPNPFLGSDVPAPELAIQENPKNTGPITLGEDPYQSFQLNQASKNVSGDKFSDTRPYLVCRTIGQPVLTPWYKLNPDNGQKGSGYNSELQSINSPVPTQSLPGVKAAGATAIPDQPPVPPSTAGRPLTPGELASLGAPTGLAGQFIVEQAQDQAAMGEGQGQLAAQIQAPLADELGAQGDCLAVGVPGILQVAQAVQGPTPVGIASGQFVAHVVLQVEQQAQGRGQILSGLSGLSLGKSQPPALVVGVSQQVAALALAFSEDQFGVDLHGSVEVIASPVELAHQPVGDAPVHQGQGQQVAQRCPVEAHDDQVILADGQFSRFHGGFRAAQVAQRLAAPVEGRGQAIAQFVATFLLDQHPKVQDGPFDLLQAAGELPDLEIGQPATVVSPGQIFAQVGALELAHQHGQTLLEPVQDRQLVMKAALRLELRAHRLAQAAQFERGHDAVHQLGVLRVQEPAVESVKARAQAFGVEVDGLGIARFGHGQQLAGRPPGQPLARLRVAPRVVLLEVLAKRFVGQEKAVRVEIAGVAKQAGHGRQHVQHHLAVDAQGGEFLDVHRIIGGGAQQEELEQPLSGAPLQAFQDAVVDLFAPGQVSGGEKP